jgi:hypothetical protein
MINKNYKNANFMIMFIKIKIIMQYKIIKKKKRALKINNNIS